VVQVQNPTDDRKRVRPVHVAIAATAKCLSGMMTMLVLVPCCAPL
jgi:hypothetical protein